VYGQSVSKNPAQAREAGGFALPPDAGFYSDFCLLTSNSSPENPGNPLIPKAGWKPEIFIIRCRPQDGEELTSMSRRDIAGAHTHPSPAPHL
jgi:hypothetical protein